MFVRHSNVSAVKVRKKKKKEHLKRPCVHDSRAGSRLWFCWCNRWLLKGFLMEGLRGETWSRVKALHHTIQRPLPWLMKRQTFTVKPRVWECKERRGSGEYGWKKQKQPEPCNHRKWHMTFRTQFVPYSNPRCKLQNQSPETVSLSSARLGW